MIRGTIILLIIALFICVYVRSRKNIVYGYVEQKKRSTDVTILGWFFITIGWFFLAIGFLGIVSIIFPIIYTPIGIGILKLKENARICGLIVQEFQIVYSIIGILAAFLKYKVKILGFGFLSVLANILLAAIIIYYLERPKVKQQFRLKLTFPIK